MRLVSIDTGDGPRAAVLREQRVHRLRGEPRTLDDVLRRGELHGLEAERESVALEDVSLLAPLARPGKIICIGLNYRAHAAEQGKEAPEMPTFFAKFANALAAPGATVPLPSWSQRVDYEAEVAFVIGARCKDVSEADALRYVAAYTLLNDLSARDYQRRTPQWMPGKTFDGSAPCGPALVTWDEAGPHDGIELALHLNGERMQRSSTADLVHSVPALVAYLSKLMTLEAGDLIATGTPSGVGSARDPRVFLQPGDEVVVSSPQLGELRTRLA